MHDKEVEPVKNILASRYLFLFAGHLSLVIGVVGLLVPVMPTSPFVIIAAACYARSSDRFYLMLINNRYFGEDIRNWREQRCVRRQVKVLSAITLAFAFSLTLLLFITPLWAQLTVGSLGILAVGAVLYIPVCDE